MHTRKNRKISKLIKTVSKKRNFELISKLFWDGNLRAAWVTNVKSFAHQPGFIKFLAQGSKGVWLKIVTFRITVWWIKDDAGIPGGLKLYTKVKNIFYTQEFFFIQFWYSICVSWRWVVFVKKSNQTKSINIV